MLHQFYFSRAEVDEDTSINPPIHAIVYLTWKKYLHLRDFEDNWHYKFTTQGLDTCWKSFYDIDEGSYAIHNHGP